MRSEIFYPFPVHRDPGLSASLLMSLFQNTRTGIFGRGEALPKCLTDDAWGQAGYCIDAPECMPAGSVMRIAISEDLGDAGEQSTYERARATGESK